MKLAKSNGIKLVHKNWMCYSLIFWRKFTTSTFDLLTKTRKELEDIDSLNK